MNYSSNFEKVMKYTGIYEINLHNSSLPYFIFQRPLLKLFDIVIVKAYGSHRVNPPKGIDVYKNRPTHGITIKLVEEGLIMPPGEEHWACREIPRLELLKAKMHYDKLSVQGVF